MRDPSRIDGIWRKIASFHKTVPDQRASQFIINILRGFENDPFYMEDEEFVNEVEKIIHRWFKMDPPDGEEDNNAGQPGKILRQELQ